MNNWMGTVPALRQPGAGLLQSHSGDLQRLFQTRKPLHHLLFFMEPIPVTIPIVPKNFLFALDPPLSGFYSPAGIADHQAR
jgi:hypothetical protein